MLKLNNKNIYVRSSRDPALTSHDPKFGRDLTGNHCCTVSCKVADVITMFLSLLLTCAFDNLTAISFPVDFTRSGHTDVREVNYYW